MAAAGPERRPRILVVRGRTALLADRVLGVVETGPEGLRPAGGEGLLPLSSSYLREEEEGAYLLDLDPLLDETAEGA
ncbi:MAG: hypothetical protein V3V62_03950 [bacterium]